MHERIENGFHTVHNIGELVDRVEADFRSDIARSRHPLRRKLGVLMQIAISGSVSKSLKPMASTFSGTNRFESVPRKAIIKTHNLWKLRPPNTVTNGGGY